MRQRRPTRQSNGVTQGTGSVPAPRSAQPRERLVSRLGKQHHRTQPQLFQVSCSLLPFKSLFHKAPHGGGKTLLSDAWVWCGNARRYLGQAGVPLSDSTLGSPCRIKEAQYADIALDVGVCDWPGQNQGRWSVARTVVRPQRSASLLKRPRDLKAVIGWLMEREEAGVRRRTKRGCTKKKDKERHQVSSLGVPARAKDGESLGGRN